jgi:hypothetical protein
LGFTKDYQHDFRSYYYGTKAASLGLNPYVSTSLSQIAGQEFQGHIRFVYPPHLLFVFKPFTYFSFATAQKLFLSVKLIALIFLFFIWFKYFLPNKNYALVLAILCIAAFHAAIQLDLWAGNISIFEQLLIWSAVLCYLKNKRILFTTLIVIVALFKITPIVFLGLLLLDKEKQSFILFGLGSLVFLLINLISYITNPLYKIFLSLPNVLDSTGYVNPALLPLIKFTILPKLAFIKTDLSQPIYLTVVLLIIFLTLYFLRSCDFKNKMMNVTILFLLYAAIIPRFKDYSYILLIIPALYVIYSLKTKWAKTILLLLLCVTLWPYHHYVNVLLLLFIYLWKIKGSHLNASITE